MSRILHKSHIYLKLAALLIFVLANSAYAEEGLYGEAGLLDFHNSLDVGVSIASDNIRTVELYSNLADLPLVGSFFWQGLERSYWQAQNSIDSLRLKQSHDISRLLDQYVDGIADDLEDELDKAMYGDGEASTSSASNSSSGSGGYGSSMGSMGVMGAFFGASTVGFNSGGGGSYGVFTFTEIAPHDAGG